MASMADWPMHARWKFVHDFVLAISGMRAQGLVHCDLKPDNVMVGPGPDFSVYLIDFGCVARPNDLPFLQAAGGRSEFVMGCVFSRKNPTGTRRGRVGVVQVLSRAVLGNVFALAL